MAPGDCSPRWTLHGAASEDGSGASTTGACFHDVEADHSQRGMLVSFQDVCYSVGSGSKKFTVLEGITGFFEPGQTTAVMGPSGSGKTSLLDVLAGRKTSGSLSGSIAFGGLPPSRALLRRATGVVEQFDTLIHDLTVAEMLLYQAQLKRPVSEPLASKQAAVQQLLAKLGLTSCQHVQIGHALKRGISGGQAKRLNIGIALITEPRVLFLDEPTSGLDSAGGHAIMQVVASLARDGTTVATTIHSPSAASFALFDRLLVLAGGRLAYFGGAGDAAVTYFSSFCGIRQPRLGDNVAELLLEAVTQADRSAGAKHDLAETYANSLQAKANESMYAAHLEEQWRRRSCSVAMQELQVLSSTASCAPLTKGGGFTSSGSSGSLGSGSGAAAGSGCGWLSCSGGGLCGCHTYVTPAWWSLKVLLQFRTGRHYRSALYVLPRVLDKLLFALVVLSLYIGKGTDFSTLNVPVLSSLMFLMVLAPLCSAVMYVPGLGMERALFIRERNDGLYRPLTYLVFKLVDELLLMLPVTLATTAAVFFGCKLQGSFLLFWLVHFATLANGTALAYAITAVSPSILVAMPVLSFLLIMLLILCGFMVRPVAMPRYWSWALRINIAHYSWGALLVNQYAGHVRSLLGGVNVLAYFSLAEVTSWHYLAVVVAAFFAWSFLAWLALAFARVHKR